MKLANILSVVLCVLGVSAGFYADGQNGKAALRTGIANPRPSFVRFTSQELGLLLADIGVSNPLALKRLQDDPAARQKQLDSLRSLLAFATEAQNEGLADRPPYSTEMENIRDETIAVRYDRLLNKDNGAKPFASISEALVSSYWGEGPTGKLPASVKSARNAKFQNFFDAKVAILKADNPRLTDKAVTDEEKQQARDIFAKIHIYVDEYAKRATLLPKSFHDKVNLHVKLQQAQLLARLYSERMSLRVEATDDEISSYVKSHPDLDTTAKRIKANVILERAKKGEDFAKLANEFSEDPGNMSEKGESHGGIYKNVGLGVMVVPFEKAALSVQPGQVVPQIVESDFGFHIIKLERRGNATAPDSPETYDVRHVLISTAIENSADPSGRPIPISQYVKSEVEKEKGQAMIDKLVAANKISVPADFAVPSEPAKVTTATGVRRPKAGSTRKRH
ncbi:MAG: peptidylprolyl isomerase [Pyrinomonadaceae bacterium]